MTGTVQRVCEHPRCAKQVPEDRRPQAKYCSDSCKRDASRVRRGDERMSRPARQFWAGYGRHRRRRPTLRIS